MTRPPTTEYIAKKSSKTRKNRSAEQQLRIAKHGLYNISKAKQKSHRDGEEESDSAYIARLKKMIDDLLEKIS